MKDHKRVTHREEIYIECYELKKSNLTWSTNNINYEQICTCLNQMIFTEDMITKAMQNAEKHIRKWKEVEFTIEPISDDYELDGWAFIFRGWKEYTEAEKKRNKKRREKNRAEAAEKKRKQDAKDLREYNRLKKKFENTQ